MGNKAFGLYNKFIVHRVDGRDEIGKKHYGCEYFVLDLDHDSHAPAAIRAYAESCREEYPLLSADLFAKFPTPTSPLLPGLERAAEICQGVHSACLAINRGTTSADPDHERFQYQANGADECGYTIRAEISCLKGEGSDHE